MCQHWNRFGSKLSHGNNEEDIIWPKDEKSMRSFYNNINNVPQLPVHILQTVVELFKESQEILISGSYSVSQTGI